MFYNQKKIELNDNRVRSGNRPAPRTSGNRLPRNAYSEMSTWLETCGRWGSPVWSAEMTLRSSSTRPDSAR